MSTPQIHIRKQQQIHYWIRPLIRIEHLYYYIDYINTTDNDFKTCKYSTYVWASGLLCISLKLRTMQKSPVLEGSFASLWYTSTTGTSRTNLNAWSMRLKD